MKNQKKICLNAVNSVKALDLEWRGVDFVITTKNQLLKIALEIYKEINNGEARKQRR